MAQFKIIWKSGVVDVVEQSDCTTVEQFVNCRFGRNADIEAFGVTVELQSETVDTAPAKPAAPVKATTKFAAKK